MQQTTCANAPLFDHLVGAGEQREGDVETKRYSLFLRFAILSGRAV